MSEFDIERGVPLMEHSRRKRAQLKFPLAELAVGDSFFIPIENEHNFGEREKVRSKVFAEHRILRFARPEFEDTKIATRVVEGGLRVWRLQ